MKQKSKNSTVISCRMMTHVTSWYLDSNSATNTNKDKFSFSLSLEDRSTRSTLAKFKKTGNEKV